MNESPVQYFGALYSTTTAEPVAYRLKRMMGFALMFAMPSDGLDEALSSLEEIIQFRLERLQTLALPAQVRRSVGKRMSSGPSPELVIAE
jgi:hypothetical protein